MMFNFSPLEEEIIKPQVLVYFACIVASDILSTLLLWTRIFKLAFIVINLYMHKILRIICSIQLSARNIEQSGPGYSVRVEIELCVVCVNCQPSQIIKAIDFLFLSITSPVSVRAFWMPQHRSTLKFVVSCIWLTRRFCFLTDTPLSAATRNYFFFSVVASVGARRHYGTKNGEKNVVGFTNTQTCGKG